MLAYSSKGLDRIKDTLDNPRVKFFTWDLSVPMSPGLKQIIGTVNIILHLAAESHVDNSIINAPECIRNNIMSTTWLLEYAKELPSLSCFLLFSTDETYGNLEPDGILFTEESRHNPRNPYSASKSACEKIATSYMNTYGIPILTVNCMNVYGYTQHVEKFIPLVIKKVLANETIGIHSYSDGKTPGSRFYVHTDTVAKAVLFVLQHGIMGECYNIAGQIELDNLSLAEMIANIINKPLKYEMIVHDSTRKGHDLRYGLDGTKLEQLGFRVSDDFESNLKSVIEWTLENPKWLEE